MQFTVRRTSNKEGIPCEEAYKTKIMMVEERWFKTPEEYDAKLSSFTGPWLSTGTNHRINNRGNIVKDMGKCDVWAVKINSMKALADFYRKYGELVITEDYRNKDVMCIEIYDDYRE